MSVDFSSIIENFLTAELGEEVRESLVAIAQNLEDAINQQLQTVDPDLNDSSPNAAAQSKVVGDRFAAVDQEMLKALRYANFDGDTLLKNQTVNTVCRLRGVTVTDAPDGVDLVNGYGWLYTVGVANGQKQQFLFDYDMKQLYYRFTYGVTVEGQATFVWTSWYSVNEEELKKALKFAEYVGGTLLGDQTANTVCRLHGYTVTDAPAGVDLNNGYGWLYTAGTTGQQRQQFLFYLDSLQNGSNTLYQRMTYGRSTGSGTEYVWTAWAVSNDNSLRYVAFSGVGVSKTLLAYQPVNTVCRLYQVHLSAGQTESEFDAPPGVDVLWREQNPSTHYAWLITTGGSAHIMQTVYDPHEKTMWQRFANIVDSSLVWTDWYLTQNPIRQTSFDGTGNDGVYLRNQAVNTVCRVSKVTLASGQTDFDQPDDVDLIYPSTYYAWLYTVGGTLRMQYMFYAHTKALYFRFFSGVSETRPTGWTDWFRAAPPDKRIKMLVVGNSFSQDSMAYVPPILNELLPDYDITISVLYKGGASIADHLQMFSDGEAYTIRSTWGPGSEKWSRRNPGGTLVNVLAEGWDIIALQDESDDVLTTAGVDAMIASARQLLRIMQAYCSTPFTAVWNQWMSRPDGQYSAAEMFALIKDATLRVMSELGVQDYIPIGAAIQSARTNDTFAALGDGGDMLYTDDTHMQAGLPALLSAYTIALKILQWSGNRQTGIYRSSFVPSDENCKAINALSLKVVDDAVVVSGMTHGLSALGSDQTEDMVVPATSEEESDKTIQVEKVTATVREYIRDMQEIAVLAVNNPAVVTDCSAVGPES